MKIHSVGFPNYQGAKTPKTELKNVTPVFGSREVYYQNYIKAWNRLDYKLNHDIEYITECFFELIKNANRFPEQYKTYWAPIILDGNYYRDIRILMEKMNHNRFDYPQSKKIAEYAQSDLHTEEIVNFPNGSLCISMCNRMDFPQIGKKFASIFSGETVKPHHDFIMYFTNPETQKNISIRLNKEDYPIVSTHSGTFYFDKSLHRVLDFKGTEVDPCPWSGTTF